MTKNFKIDEEMTQETLYTLLLEQTRMMSETFLKTIEKQNKAEEARDKKFTIISCSCVGLVVIMFGFLAYLIS